MADKRDTGGYCSMKLLNDNHLEILIDADLMRSCGVVGDIPVTKAWVNKEYPQLFDAIKEWCIVNSIRFEVIGY